MNCRDCRDQLHAFLDGELAPTPAEAVQAHLDDCSACFARSEWEEAFRRTVRGLHRAEGPPAHLAETIRQSLDAEDRRRSRLTVVGGERRAAPWRPWVVRAFVGVAATLLVFALAGLLEVRMPWGADTPAPGEAHPLFLRGELVCLDCLMLEARPVPGALDRQLPPATVPSTDPAEHRGLHLRGSGGRLWELYPEAEVADGLAGHENVGRDVTLVGTAYPELGAMRVARLSLH